MGRGNDNGSGYIAPLCCKCMWFTAFFWRNTCVSSTSVLRIISYDVIECDTFGYAGVSGNLDSRNITEIDIGKTTITDSTGTIANIDSYIHLTGANGESFTVGKNSNGRFEFSVEGKSGTQTMYLDSSGKLNITESAILTIDGGEW